MQSYCLQHLYILNLHFPISNALKKNQILSEKWQARQARKSSSRAELGFNLNQARPKQDWPSSWAEFGLWSSLARTRAIFILFYFSLQLRAIGLFKINVSYFPTLNKLASVLIAYIAYICKWVSANLLGRNLQYYHTILPFVL